MSSFSFSLHRLPCSLCTHTDPTSSCQYPRFSVSADRAHFASRAEVQQLVTEYVHFYNFERISRKSGLTPVEIRGKAAYTITYLQQGFYFFVRCSENSPPSVRVITPFWASRRAKASPLMIKRMLSLQQVVHHRFTAIRRGLAGFQVVDVTDLIRVAGQVFMGP